MSGTAWQIDETRGPSALQPSCREGNGGQACSALGCSTRRSSKPTTLPPLADLIAPTGLGNVGSVAQGHAHFRRAKREPGCAARAFLKAKWTKTGHQMLGLTGCGDYRMLYMANWPVRGEGE